MKPTMISIAGLETLALEQVRIGQRCAIFAISLTLMAFAGIVLTSGDGAAATAAGVLFAPSMVIGFVLSLAGVFLLSAGFGYGTILRILIILGLFIPPISLNILLILNLKATSVLRAAGYKVGLLGAAPKAF